MPLYPAPLPSGPYLSLPAGWDAAWKVAKASVGSQHVNVVGIGDSIIAGQNSTDIMLDSFWARLRATLLSANGNTLGGDSYSLLYSAQYGLGTATPPVFASATSTGYYCGFNYGTFSSGPRQECCHQFPPVL